LRDNFSGVGLQVLSEAGNPGVISQPGYRVRLNHYRLCVPPPKAEKGTYNQGCNPDGQSDTLVGAFTITDPLPTISGLSPGEGNINEVLSLRINGQNFNEGVKVSFTKGSTEIVCTSPVSSDGTKILCNLDLTGAATGDWDVTVLNIDGQLKVTWTQKFHVTNST
jgi:hypothetical protein